MNKTDNADNEHVAPKRSLRLDIKRRKNGSDRHNSNDEMFAYPSQCKLKLFIFLSLSIFADMSTEFSQTNTQSQTSLCQSNTTKDSEDESDCLSVSNSLSELNCLGDDESNSQDTSCISGIFKLILRVDFFIYQSKVMQYWK